MTGDLNQIQLSIELVGGLALFLFGMDVMSKALRQVAGSSLKMILARVTDNRFFGLVAGASVTAIIQSSSITTVLLVGLISAGLMTSAQSVAVIFGANIGTTITAQILAFNVTSLALPVLSLGFFISFIAERKALREYGRIILGVGLVFFGMTIMSDAMKPLRDYGPFLEFMISLDNVLVAALVGAIFTALVQSSSATTGILIVMVGQGVIALEPAVALSLGANIGTCVTALLASIGTSQAALRAALVHTLFNVAGVLIWIGFVSQLVELSGAMSDVMGDISLPRQLANAHTIFNVVNALLFIGLASRMSRFVEWLAPDREGVVRPEFAPIHLDPKLLDIPAIAIDAARLEILRLGQLLRVLVAEAVPAVISGSPLDVDRLRVMDRPVDLLHRGIVDYMRQIGLRSLPAGQSERLLDLLKIADDMEHAGDLVATGLVTSARKRMDEDVVISPATAAVISAVHQDVLEALDGVLKALDEQDAEAAASVRQMKARFSTRVEEAARHQAKRLRADEPKRLQAYAREIELTETMDDIFKILRRIARTELRLFGKAAKATTI